AVAPFDDPDGLLRGDQEGQAGERRADERGLHVDFTGLATELRDRERVRDGLLAGVGLARAARGEAHSGPAARLEDAERGEPERKDEQEAPAAVCARERQRSEEHTSELQSLAYLVCRLLLEKKKKQQKENS